MRIGRTQPPGGKPLSARQAADELQIQSGQLSLEPRARLTIEGLQVRTEPGLAGRLEALAQRPSRHPSKRARSRETLCPPKPRELLREWSICSSRASFGT